MGYSPWGLKELGTTEWLNQQSQRVEFWQREETEQNRKMKVKNDMCGFFLCYMGTGYSGKSCMLYVIAVAHFPHCQWVCVHTIIYWMMWLKGFIKSLLTARRCAGHYKVGKTSKISSYLEFGIGWISLLTNKQTNKQTQFYTWMLGSYLTVTNYHCNYFFLTSNLYCIVYYCKSNRVVPQCHKTDCPVPLSLLKTYGNAG